MNDNCREDGEDEFVIIDECLISECDTEADDYLECLSSNMDTCNERCDVAICED